MMTRVLLAAGLAAALVGASALALAQGPPGPAGMPGGPGRGPRGPLMDFGLRGIELTDTQRQQVRSIVDAHQAEFAEVGRKLGDAHRAFAEAVEADSVDEAVIRARSTAVASAMADEAILRAKVRSEVHAVLTPDQLQQLKERREQMDRGRQERQQRRQPRPPGR